MAPRMTYTSTKHRTIVGALRRGVTYDTAAARARVTPRTVQRWRERGARELATIEDGGTPVASEECFARFALDCASARARAELDLLERLDAAKPGEWQKIGWRLERQFSYLAKEQREVFVTHNLPDVAAAFGTTDPAEAAKRADATVWGSD